MQRFGEKVRTLRQQREMTIKQLAVAIGHSTHSHISEFETGKRRPSLELAMRIAQIFDVPLDQLVRDDLEIE